MAERLWGTIISISESWVFLSPAPKNGVLPMYWGFALGDELGDRKKVHPLGGLGCPIYGGSI